MKSLKNYMVILDKQCVEYMLAYDISDASRSATAMYGDRIINIVEIARGK